MKGFQEKELELKLFDPRLAVGKASLGGKKLQDFLLFYFCFVWGCLRVLSPKLITLCVDKLLGPEVCPMLAYFGLLGHKNPVLVIKS